MRARHAARQRGPAPISSPPVRRKSIVVSPARRSHTRLQRSRRLSQPEADSFMRDEGTEAARRQSLSPIKLLAHRVPLHYRIRMTQPDFARDSSLPRRLGLWSAIAVLIGTTIGSG